MEGWVKLHRKLLEATIFQNPNLLKFWIWCLLKATHKEHKERVGLQEITLYSGQFVFGRNKAALELDMTPSTVYKYLKIMEKEQLITIESNNKFSVVSIVKWEFYQSEDKNCDSKVTANVATKKQQSDSKVTPKEQQSNTNKNEKNVKNEKKDILCKADASELFERLWKLYPLKRGKGKVSDAKKKQLLDIGYEQMEKAIDRYKADLAKDDWRKPQNGSTFFNSGYLDYLDGNYEKPKAEPSTSVKTQFHNFDERDYDFDDLERRLFEQQINQCP